MGRFIYYLAAFGPLALGLCLLAWSTVQPLEDQTHDTMVGLVVIGFLSMLASMGMRAWVKSQGLARW